MPEIPPKEKKPELPIRIEATEHDREQLDDETIEIGA
jgi:hypothetical protein